MEYLIIQLAAGTVVAARYSFSGKHLTFTGAAEFTLDNELELAEVAGRIAAGLRGTERIVLCLSPASVAQRRVSLPLTDLNKVREIIPSHLQGETALPVEDAVFDVLPSGEGSYLAVWARRDDVRRLVDLFTAAGCEPRFVTCEPLAWGFLPECPAEALVCGDEGYAVIRSGQVQFFGMFSGMERSRKLIAATAMLEDSGITVPQRLIMIGGQATELAHLPGLPFPEMSVLPEAWGASFKNESTFLRLAGTAAVALAAHAGRLVNFRRGALAWTAGDAGLRRKLRVTAALALVAVLMLFASLGIRYRAAQADLVSLNSSIAGMYREVFPTRAKAVDEVSEIKGEIRKLSGAAGESGFLDALKLVAAAKGATINGLFEAELDGRTLRVKGDAASNQAVTEFVSALSPHFATVTPGELKGRPDGGVSFSLTATLKESKP